MIKNALQDIVEDLKAGRTPTPSVDGFPCFSEQETQGNPHVEPATLFRMAASWGSEELPVFERALGAIERGELAWLGFKVVYDSQVAQANTDNEVTKKYGAQGSADGKDLVFFCNDAKEVVSSRQPSPRDLFQMKDATRGPSMHSLGS